jgi:hypothetical protein
MSRPGLHDVSASSPGAASRRSIRIWRGKVSLPHTGDQVLVEARARSRLPLVRVESNLPGYVCGVRRPLGR